MQQVSSERFCGRTFNGDEVDQIKEIVSTCNGISRTELANTVCELFDWKRPTGRLKTVECRQFLEHLAAQGILDLPDRKAGRPKGVKVTVKRTDKAQAPGIITGNVNEFCPLRLRKVTSKAQRDLWYEYVDRYHYLGYQLPFGAQLRYFIKAGNGNNDILGCFQFSQSGLEDGSHGTDGLVGPMSNERSIYKRSLITAGFSFFLGLRSKILPVRFLRWRPRPFRMIGNAATGIVRFLWKHWLIKNDLKALAIRRPTGYIWERQQAAGGWTVSNQQQGAAVKDIYVYPLTSRFRQELVGIVKGGVPWDLQLALLNRIQQEKFRHMIHDEVDKWVDQIIDEVFEDGKQPTVMELSQLFSETKQKFFGACFQALD